MADATPKPLIFNDWNNGMADSPVLGVGLLQDVSIDTVPGALMPNYAPTVLSPTPSSSVFTWDYTVNSGTGTITGSFPEMMTGTAIQLTNSGGSAPTGLSVATTYFIIKVSTTTFQLATTITNALASTAITTTGDGSGTNTMATVNFGTAKHSAMDPVSGNVFVLDNNGNLWGYDLVSSGRISLIVGETLTGGETNAGNGLVGMRNYDLSHFYLFVFGAKYIDVLDATSLTLLGDPVGNSLWTNGWQSMNSGLGFGGSHQGIQPKNKGGAVYYCDQNWVGSIVELSPTPFSPSNSSSYTFLYQALALPAGEQASWIDEFTNSILIGGSTYNYVYQWDRSSRAINTFWSNPEINVQRIKNIGNTVYMAAGLRGNIYQSSGYVALFTGKIPEWVTQSTTATQVAWGGIGQKGGWLLLGIGTTGAGNGIWAIDPTNPQFSTMAGLGGRRLLENQLANGSAVSTILVPTDQASASQEFYYLGGVGEFSQISTNRYNALSTSGGGAIDDSATTPGIALYKSGLRAVGNKITKAKYSRLEVQLNQPGASGNTIRVSWRSGSSGSWTIMAGGSTNGVFVADGTVTSFTQDIGLHDLENIQVMIELKGAGSGSNALELMSVILYP